jgi:hypothetical protein
LKPFNRPALPSEMPEALTLIVALELLPLIAPLMDLARIIHRAS